MIKNITEIIREQKIKKFYREFIQKRNAIIELSGIEPNMAFISQKKLNLLKKYYSKEDYIFFVGIFLVGSKELKGNSIYFDVGDI